MKHFVSALITVMLLAISTAVFAQQSTIDFKVGAGYPKAPEKVGFDSAIDINLGLDKYFNLGLEAGFGWIQWKNNDFAQAAGGMVLTKVEKANLYSFPVLAIASIRFADVESSAGILPFISGGAGYSWTYYNHPEYQDTFHGFTWQVSAGAQFSPGEGSNMKVVLEAGYRGAAIQNADDLELDMSGAFGRLGVSFPIASAE